MPVTTLLPYAECERLLRSGSFGRVAFVTPRGPEIYPVNYSVVGSAVSAHVDPSGQLARWADGADVAFEVDLADYENGRGWSVVARGRGRVSVSPPPASELPRPRPWASGDRSASLNIAWSSLTGRKIGAGWDCRDAMPSARMLP